LALCSIRKQLMQTERRFMYANMWF
jgi:hypothetical protein